MGAEHNIRVYSFVNQLSCTRLEGFKMHIKPVDFFFFFLISELIHTAMMFLSVTLVALTCSIFSIVDAT